MARYIKVEAAAPPPRTARYSHAVEAGLAAALRACDPSGKES